MGKVVIHATMSLDGFIAGPNDDLDWMSDYIGPNEVADQMIRMAGAVVSGGRYFRLVEKSLGITEDMLPYGGATKVPVFIVTHQPREAISGFGVTFSFITDGIEAAAKQAAIAANRKHVMIFGASLGQQCLQLGLVDEIQLHLVPLLLGQGLRLFDHLGPGPIRLENMKVVQSPKVTDLRFRIMSR